ncbi:hypothetical protein AAFC00_005674 [Neodothiora populina]|uniref:Fe2OG dioxygenase domain-containing protein n=1 Tax=Neodothiora populina TaxID=2781224 RepID=A0ABR3P5R1_9PEZI
MATLSKSESGGLRFTIPTVDLTAYLDDSESHEADKIVAKIRDACKASGFLQIVGHGVPSSLQHQVFNAAKKVFDLPDAEKMQLRGQNGRGYEIFGAQILQVGARPDFREGYSIGPDWSHLCPPYRDFQHPNIWPPAHLISEADFKHPLLDYHKRLSALCGTLMTILGRGLLNVDTSVFTKFSEDPLATSKLIHYPPHPVAGDSLQFGAGAHSDFGAITLLLQDQSAGLQVLNRSTGKWINVPPNKDAYVVNVGDMLDRWTKGEYKSNLHRVINASGTDRYSIPFFYDGNLDCVIKPLDGSNGEHYTVEEYMQSRYAATYKN